MKIQKNNEVIAICEFGSYGTEYWIEGRSDIDLLVVTSPSVTFINTFNIEEKLREIAIKFYKYNNIHLFSRFYWVYNWYVWKLYNN